MPRDLSQNSGSRVVSITVCASLALRLPSSFAEVIVHIAEHTAHSTRIKPLVTSAKVFQRQCANLSRPFCSARTSTCEFGRNRD